MRNSSFSTALIAASTSAALTAAINKSPFAPIKTASKTLNKPVVSSFLTSNIAAAIGATGLVSPNTNAAMSSALASPFATKSSLPCSDSGNLTISCANAESSASTPHSITQLSAGTAAIEPVIIAAIASSSPAAGANNFTARSDTNHLKKFPKLSSLKMP